jgi:hypothetical protein
MRTKDLAESQFNFDAPPISLGVKFDKFMTDYEFDFTTIDDHVEYEPLEPPILISDDNSDIECDPRSLVLLANDIHPEKRDSESEKHNQQLDANFDTQSDTSENDNAEHLDDSLNQPMQIHSFEKTELNARSVKSIDFQIQDREFRRDIEDHKRGNSAVSAIKLLLLSLKKFDEHELKLMSINEESEFRFNSMLIDKSMSSIKFINKTAVRIQHLIMKSDAEYGEISDDRASDIKFLNRNVARTKRDFLLHYAIIAKHIKFSHVELNSYPALDLGLHNQHRFVSCHKILNYLNFSTLHQDSPEFKSIDKLVKNFPSFYDSGRLHYLNYLVSEWKSGNLFFDSQFISFFEDTDSRWINKEFPGINKWLKKFDRIK